ncbi:ABC-F family ATP-binding cassette domain-containing protein [Pediococcus acidilactici]|mgnify:CR=1 FL=1|uniref:ABC-F family ATP-binding cassette domain-containing protein n=1 Tax=Pediococcus acidilactici TaxID=1254 RepID=UPI000327093E|nr:ABC-F family ATP-binding cassette domain-containing protein [Pediococcus acidilactici]EOA09377.1 ATP-binding cassette protein, ChvD family [Pediococcus acidilactici D3]MBW4796857.1 ABC-F family ATP-binding cassette domain-containing protein [Pediococcus acidilactici]MBW9306109.1 ABC-F family ATP-binding cassette domain-containing protein [Pediococcus acidilactici]MCE5961469.1 ATP-binding cassette domain-containing protein [Pediococcus acidilactici]MCW8082400.1 ABC-F family ATP-binding casse
MKTLKAKNLTKTYGEKQLFQSINFTINENDRIGLIGTNGSGKTNLLNAVAGIDPADSGEFEAPNDYRIAYLKQSSEINQYETVRDFIYSGDQEVFRVIKRYEQVLAQYTDNPTSSTIFEKFTKAEDEMNRLDAWNTESNIKTILTQLHVDMLDAPINQLSGGQVKRIALAQALLEPADLLLLDEPTNHLDFDSIEWLEKYLADYKGALLLVTHDRYFLDRVTNHIWELSFGHLYEYEGNYAKYVEQKALREQQNEASQEKKYKFYKQELEWIKRGPKARGTKQQARINKFEKLDQDVHAPKEIDQDVEIGLIQQRLGKKVIEIKHLDLQVGDHPIARDFTKLIQAGDRIGITGANGAGKSSFLNAIAGKLPIQGGTIDIGETVKIGYYTQKMEPIPEDKRVINYIKEIGQEVVNRDGEKISVTSLLEQFLFPKFMHGSLIKKLSGGEKRRLYLIKVLMQQPNVLLLDEPTNDLDIATLTVLENYLEHFNGTVLTVSHDRYFLDKVSDQLLIFDGNGQIGQYTGQISDYLKQRAQTTSTNATTAKPRTESTPVAKPKKKKKRTYAEEKEWQTIEAEIDKLEQKSKTITEQMNEYAADYGKLSELQAELNQVSDELENKMARWEYLESFEEGE